MQKRKRTRTAARLTEAYAVWSGATVRSDEDREAAHVILANHFGRAVRLLPAGPVGVARWLDVAARNEVLAVHRRSSREAEVVNAAGARHADTAGPVDALSDAVRREAARHVAAAILKLPVLERRALISRAIDRRPCGEIAQQLLGRQDSASRQTIVRIVAVARGRVQKTVVRELGADAVSDLVAADVGVLVDILTAAGAMTDARGGSTERVFPQTPPTRKGNSL